MTPTFDAVVKDYTGLLLNILTRKTYGDHQLAQDILQETFISIWKQFDKVRWDDNPAGLFLSIAHRRLVDHYRKKRPAEFSISSESVNEVVIAVEDDPLPEWSDRVQFALNDLPDGMKVCVEAVIIEGYTHKEVSDKYNIPLGTVLSRVNRGREKLRVFLKNQGMER